ncbi:hypothetical protein QTP88_017540 [Uroleucon formosanum]
MQLAIQNIKKIPEPNIWEPKKDDFFYDIKLETDDGKIIYGHKVVLASACQYFNAMFTNFEEKDQDLVIMRQLNSSALQLFVDFMYFEEIMVTEKNVQLIKAVAYLG